MPIRTYYFKEHSFMLNEFSGGLDDESLMKLINDVNDKTEGITGLRQLSDCRELQNIDNLTVQGTVISSNEEINRPQSLLAILVPEFNQQIYGMAKVYQSFSEANRKAVKIFTDLDEALSWLAQHDQEKELLKKFVNENLS